MSEQLVTLISEALSSNKFLFGFSLVAMLTLLVVILYKLDKSPNSQYSFVDMFLDDNGKASSTKFAQIIALLLSSWGFIALVLADRLTEYYFGLFMASWVLNRGVTKFLESKNTPPVVPPTQ